MTEREETGLDATFAWFSTTVIMFLCRRIGSLLKARHSSPLPWKFHDKRSENLDVKVIP